MDLGVISIRYARALIKASIEEKVEDKVYANMTALNESYIAVPELRHTVDNPMLPHEKKLEILLSACGDNTCELTKRFFNLVIDEGREQAVLFIANSFITLYRQQKNITSGKLTTAVPVSQEVENKMKEMVKERTRGTVEFNTKVDADILGGFILEYDTYRMDASVKNKLRSIETLLKK